MVAGCKIEVQCKGGVTADSMASLTRSPPTQQYSTGPLYKENLMTAVESFKSSFNAMLTTPWPSAAILISTTIRSRLPRSHRRAWRLAQQTARCFTSVHTRNVLA